jgi:putative methionine-R-sulfoxide reductase with GAF domain
MTLRVMPRTEKITLSSCNQLHYVEFYMNEERQENQMSRQAHTTLSAAYSSEMKRGLCRTAAKQNGHAICADKTLRRSVQ